MKSKRMKILLVTPWDKKHGRYRGLLSPFVAYRPLTLPTLAALVPKELHAQIDVCDEMVDNANRYIKRYDVVAFSFVSAEAGRAYMLARRYRALGSFVVFGGYHMMHNQEEGLRHAHAVIVGPGELAWPKLLRDVAAGRPRRVYHMPHIAPGDMVTPKRGVLPRRKYLNYPTMLANPNCRKNCDFCAISRMWDSRPRPVGEVIRDMRAQRSKYYIFYDPDFFDDRAYAIALMKAMTPLKIRWAGAACVGCAGDEELMYWAEKSGCAALLLGLESMSPRALRASHKAGRPARYKKAIDRLRRAGISVNGCFVLGMDGDTERDLRLLPFWVDYLGLTLTRFALLTPIPGGPLYHRLDAEGRILSRNWDDYTQNEVVFQPLAMSPERLKEIYFEVWKRAFSWHRVLRRARNAPAKTFPEKMVALVTNIGFKYLGKDVL